MNYVDPALGKLNLLVNSSTVGASGSVYGILLGFGMLFPNMPLFLMFIPFPIKAKYMVGGYAVLELLLGLSNIRATRWLTLPTWAACSLPFC